MKKLLFTVTMALMVLAISFSLTQTTLAQSITSGDISGTVTDPSGAVLAGATVTLKNTETGATQTTKTSPEGSYRFALLGPGRYNITVSQAGFQDAKRYVDVLVGQVMTANIQVALASSTQTVEVTEAAAAVQAENADLSTTFTSMQVAELPNPGNDTTYIAFTAPCVDANTRRGYCHFSQFGLPPTPQLS